jgi:hypothetical protein
MLGTWAAAEPHAWGSSLTHDPLMLTGRVGEAPNFFINVHFSLKTT